MQKNSRRKHDGFMDIQTNGLTLCVTCLSMIQQFSLVDNKSQTCLVPQKSNLLEIRRRSTIGGSNCLAMHEHEGKKMQEKPCHAQYLLQMLCVERGSNILVSNRDTGAGVPFICIQVVLASNTRFCDVFTHTDTDWNILQNHDKMEHGVCSAFFVWHWEHCPCPNFHTLRNVSTQDGNP